MDFFRDHILTILVFLPALGAIPIFFMPRGNPAAIKSYAAFVTFVGFVLSLPLWTWYDQAKTGIEVFQFQENHPWIQALGVNYHVGVDGIAVLLILLTTLLGFLAVVSSFAAIATREKEYYVFLLLLQTGMIGVFVSLDFFLFYVFWEVMLVPMYFLIGVWGGPRKLYAAIKFFLYTLFGSVLMLLGILALYFYYSKGIPSLHFPGLGNDQTFDVLRITELGLRSEDPSWWDHNNPQASLSFWVCLVFFLGFAIKVPMFPFHTWLPAAHVEAPTAGSVILAGVLLKMGTYGFVRFSLPITPDATRYLLPWFVGLSIIGIIYGAMTAMMQKDIKKLVAYSSVSHLGFCMIGIFALNENGIAGGVLQMINHGISTGALFLIVGVVYERFHTRMIADYGGLSKALPKYAVVFLIMTMSSIGLPGLNGFIGEFTILYGVFQENWRWAAWAATGIVLGAAYMLWLYQRVMFGELRLPGGHGAGHGHDAGAGAHGGGGHGHGHDEPEVSTEHDLNGREMFYFAPLIALAFWIGLYPMPIFRMMDGSVKYIVQQVHQGDSIPALASTKPATGEPGPGEPKQRLENVDYLPAGR
ncbi:MAG: NADH-quinone oxidoreductase subunit M [Acidobacteriota bacterium]